MAKPNKNERIAAMLTALIITAAVALAFLIARGFIDPVKLFGICGFEQRRNIPCPFCGMTRSVGMFVTGNFADSLRMQPAAAIMCVTAALVWLYSIARALGCPMVAVTNTIKKIKPIVAIAAIILIILIGWLISLYNY